MFVKLFTPRYKIENQYTPTQHSLMQKIVNSKEVRQVPANLKKNILVKTISTLIVSLYCILPANANNTANTDSCNIPKSYYKNIICTSDTRYLLAVKDNGSPVALLNSDGKKTTELFDYDRALHTNIQSGLLPVYKNGKIGYINSKGVVAIPLIYDSLGGTNWARPANDSRIVVKKAGRFGVINTSNKTIVPFTVNIEYITDYSNGIAEMRKSGQLYSLNTSGNAQLIKTNNEDTSQNANNQNNNANTLPIKTDSGKVIKSTSRRITNQNPKKTAKKPTPKVPKKIKAPQAKAPKKPVAKTNTKPLQKPTPLAQKKTSTEINLSYQQAEALYQTVKTNKPKQPLSTLNKTENINHMPLIPSQKGGKWGFVDDKNITMITYSFDEVMPFSDGLAGVRIDDDWGFLNEAGDLVIDFKFDKSSINYAQKSYHGVPTFTFYKGKAWVGNLKDGEKICINTDGKNISCD